MRALLLLPLIGLALSACKPDPPGLTIEPPPADPPVDTVDTVIVQPVGENPIAVCEVNKNPVQPPFETARFDGSASYDPNDLEIIGYEWALTLAPDGNGAALSANIGPTTSLTPQLAGTYVVELNVINELGVEMFWSHANEDMDLHVLKPGGVARGGTDCYFANCRNGLDWGTQGEDADDPVLDLDDIPGVGPENINVSDPEPGEFTVFVHDYPSTGVRPEPTDVTVNIYLGGEQVFSETRRITGENSDEYYARVNPTTGIVSPM
jgi:hypothetical protein